MENDIVEADNQYTANNLAKGLQSMCQIYDEKLSMTDEVPDEKMSETNDQKVGIFEQLIEQLPAPDEQNLVAETSTSEYQHDNGFKLG